MNRSQLALAVASLLLVWGQLDLVSLYSIDGPVHALVAGEIAEMPWWQWAAPTWFGEPYLEHPPLAMWLLAISVRLFGHNTVAVLLPAFAVTSATIALAYAIGRELVDKHFALWAAALLLIAPSFLKEGRNPTLEPFLQFFIGCAIYAYLVAVRRGRISFAALSGLAFGAALLTKGPPALLVLGGIVLRPRLRYIAVLCAVAALCLIGFDAWHYAVTDFSFFRAYGENQLYWTVVKSRAIAHNDVWFYTRLFFRGALWPFVLVAPFVVYSPRGRRFLPALAIGGAMVVGTWAGFTLMKHKYPWYVSIWNLGMATCAAIPFAAYVTEATVQRWFPRIVGALAALLLIVDCVLPGLFSRYPRPTEHFLEAGRSSVLKETTGRKIANCAALDPWRALYLTGFYWNAKLVNCDDPDAKFRVVRQDRAVLATGERLVFAYPPLALIAN